LHGSILPRPGRPPDAPTAGLSERTATVAGMATTTARARPGRIAGIVAVTLVVAVALAVLVAAVAYVVRARQTAPPPVPPPEQCLAVVGDYSGAMALDQAANAAIIAGESLRRGLPARAVTIALATAWQESWLRNLDWGDRDSLGLFQQRPSQGWGTPEQIMDPWYASGAFYDALVKVPDWQTGDVNDVAQAVQRSGVPDGYRPHEGAARAFASVLTGQAPAVLSCVDRGTTPGDPAVLTDLFRRVWGDRITIAPQPSGLLVTAPDDTTAWAVAGLALASTGQAGVTGLAVGPRHWIADPMRLAVWTDIPATPAGVTPTPPAPTLTASQVLITLR